MQTPVSITRRVRVAGIDAEDVAVHGELFNTFSKYGVIEEVLFEEDRDFHSGSVTIQFQRLSSAERLQNDLSSSGRRWIVSYLPPIVHVGEKLLATSLSSLDISLLRSLISQDVEDVAIEEKVLQVPHTLSSEAAEIAATSATPAVIGGHVGNRGAAKVKPPSSRNEGVVRMFLQAVSRVKARTIGKYAAVMSFKDVHSANAYLTNNQATLATNNAVYVTHIGPNGELIHALKDILLTRWALKEVKVGSVLRGVVLPQSSEGGVGNTVTSCDVDVGLARKGRTIVVRAKTNFTKVFTWDFVEVKLTSIETAREGNFVEADLCATLNAVNGGLSGTGNNSDLLHCLARRGGLSSLVSSSSCDVLTKGDAPSSSKKELAGRLFKALQERKAAAEGGSDSSRRQRHWSSTAERVHAFPTGIHTLSTISVCILRVDDDGLHARIAAPPHVTTSTIPAASSVEWPVFIPSMFVPSEGGSHWREFAVPGERMSVAVLYATSIGGSEAALRLVASKRDAEMRRASFALSHGAFPDEEEQRQRSGQHTNESLLLPGTSFSGTRVVWLPSTPSTDDPVYIVLPASTSPPQLFTLSIFMHETCPTSGSTHASAVDAVMSTLVVSEVVHEPCRGYYAVAVEEPTYRQQQEERRTVQSQVESEQEKRVQRILAEALAGCKSGQSNAKAEVLDEVGQKRQRSPGV
ncbi:hypothetical protein, conserved [Trypanosoma brucei gambiense DAL972]|uniref:RRM domain-containing protein n=1 Tax=Trypanosoma brucei gambiense (strain MHOM/CI/86/DAL972) TaxID=679716 RepID=D0A2D1_TRYB9|nr:hypothetical protein, conserved [Trypanosoma brucei gambiense DAL972]CBH15425.1 hypothetical protein, conserved [Trypanosoma brucei gambiense DAL972]|eukprot:XP_011777689.1 hypothetical protein, conserved [Trypanosoma brucei gambiense DAL972]